MNGDDFPVRPRGVQDDHDPDVLLYDYSKYLLTLALLVLGGVLSLTQGAAAEAIPRKPLIVVVVLLAVSGVSSLSAANEVVRARTEGRAVRARSRYFSQAAMGTLGMGVGAFLSVWVKALL